jgi:hypothetical protein
MRSIIKYCFSLIALLVAFAAPRAFAGDHLNLEDGIPVQVEDAFPIAFNGRELQSYVRYDRTDEGKDRFDLVPRLEYGFAMNWQVEVEAPFILGSVDKASSGNVVTTLLYNFNTETLWLPAIALKGGLEFPSGIESAGVDTRLKLVLSKTLSRSSFFHRIHANLEWRHNNSAKTDEREDRYLAVLGYQLRLDPNNQLIVDVYREQDRSKDKASNVAEVGWRHQWDPLTVLSAGAGAGFADQSPEIRGTLGFQRALNFP